MNTARIALFMATSGHSGVDRVARNLMAAFIARGLAVDLLHVAGHGPDPDRAPAGVRVIELGTRHAVSALPALVRYLKRERPDGLLCDKHKVNLVAIAARGLARGTTRLVIRTGTTVSLNLAHKSRLDRMLHGALVRGFYPRADAFVMPSVGAADDTARFTGLDRASITTIANPIVGPALQRDADAAPDHPWFAAPRELPVILGVGELSARKDFQTLLAAFAEVRRNRDARLVILGDGRQRDALQEQAGRLEVEADIDLPGFVDNPYGFIARADLLVCCSRWEGLGVVLVEALGLGTPVVSTDCPSGPREILDDGRLGDLVPVGDAHRLATAIAQRLDKPRDSDQLRASARRYSVADNADRYLKLLLDESTYNAVAPIDDQDP